MWSWIASRNRATQARIPVHEVRDGVAWLGGGEFRLMLRLGSINFALKDAAARDATVSAYASFLNALDFPLQLVVRTRRYDPSAYVEFLRSGRAPGEGAEGLRGPLAAFVEGLTRERRMVTRELLAVVPWTAPETAGGWLGRPAPVAAGEAIWKRAAAALGQRALEVEMGLGRVGVEGRRLDTAEVALVLHASYNPRLTDVYREADVLDRIAVEVAGDGAVELGWGEHWQDFLAPASIEIAPGRMTIDEQHCRTVVAAGYPRYVTPAWLEPLLTLAEDTDVALHVEPLPADVAAARLRQRIAQLESGERMEAERGGRPEALRSLTLRDAQVLEAKLLQGAGRFFYLSLYATVYAPTAESLDEKSRLVETTLAGMLVQPRRALFQMEAGFASTQPLGVDLLKVRRSMDSASLAACFPFLNADLAHPDGVLLGVNRRTTSLVILNRFRLESYNVVVFARSGAGKSYLVKLELLRSFLAGVEAVVIDPEDEYGRLAQAVGGSVVRLGGPGGDAVNPFDLGPSEEPGGRTAKVFSLQALLDVLLGELSPRQKSLLEKGLLRVYEVRGITDDPATYRRPAPLMGDLYRWLRARARRGRGHEAREAEDLVSRLERFAEGTPSHLVNRHTTVNLASPFLVFSLRDLEPELKRAGMFLVLDYVWSLLRDRRARRKRLLTIDEAWLLMQSEGTAQFLYRMAKTARKYWVGFTCVSQDVGDFLSSELGQAVVNNAAVHILLKQSPQAIDRVSDAFKLSREERNLLLNAGLGEGLLRAAGTQVALQVVASPEEHPLVTSDPAELAMLEAGEEGA